MGRISYNPGTKRVRQVLGTVYSGDLEGEFGQVINRIMAEYGSYQKYTTGMNEIPERGYAHERYNDGSETKLVKFDKLYLDWASTYENERELRVIGERAMDASELAAMEAEKEKQVEREKEQLRKLKEKYPNES